MTINSFKNILSLYISFILKIFDYKGKASRKEFIYLIILNTSLIFLLWIPFGGILNYLYEYLIFITQNIIHQNLNSNILAPSKPFFLKLVGIVLDLCTFSLVVRRLNDTGKSWLYIFIVFIPLLGPILFLLSLFKESSAKYNQN